MSVRAKNCEGLHLENDHLQYIARISHGKDSLKMLDVIVTRGLRLDRITTTDIWATDTIRGEHPKMVEFKDMGDEYIWRKYRIEVEHLCARNPDGTKRTYEQMFYHVPIRRSQVVQVERESSCRGRFSDSRICGMCGVRRVSSEQPSTRIQGFPAQIGSWCKKLKIDYIRIPRVYPTNRSMVPEAQNPRFLKAPPRGAVKISWSTSASRQTSRSASAS